MKKIIVSISVLFVMSFSFVGCGEVETQSYEDTPNPQLFEEDAEYMHEMEEHQQQEYEDAIMYEEYQDDMDAGVID